MNRRASICALAAAILALATLGAGVRWGAMVAGGADSYGYVSQAGYWQRGSVVVQEDVIRPSPWPGAALTWAPLGYRPSPRRPDAIVPLYAPGLPLLMALGQAIAGFCGAFFVVPLCGALTIWLTFALGRRVFDAPGIALWSAGLVATSPVFLYQLMNAMSDVPVTAAWTLALVLAVARRPLTAGLAMTVAIAIRPNLAPLAGVVMVWMAFSEASQGGRAVAVSSCARFAAGVAVSVIGIVLFNARVYRIGAHVRLRHHRRSVLAGILLTQRPAVRHLGDRRRDAVRPCCDRVLHRASRSTRCANPVPPHPPWRFAAGRADVVPLLPAIRRVVVPPVPAADVAGDDAPGGGGDGIDRAAVAAARISLRNCRRGRCDRVAWRQDGRRSERVRSRPQRAPVHRRRAIHCRPHRSGRGHPQRAAQRVAATLCRSSDAAIRRPRSALARSCGGVPRVDWTTAVLRAGRWGSGCVPAAFRRQRTVRAPSTGRRWRRSAALFRSTIQSAVVERRHRSRLRCTRGAHAFCDPPQSWPPVLRMK